jgi:hypothetical protein
MNQTVEPEQPTDYKFRDQKPRIYNQNTRLNDDWCVKEAEVRNNRYLENAVIADYTHISQRAEYNQSMNEPGVYPSNHYGMKEAIVYDTDLRNGNQGGILTADKDKSSKLLMTRTFVAGPFKGTGEMTLQNPDIKSRTMVGENTHTRRSSRRGTTQDRFEPLVPEVSTNAQNVNHIIEDHWVRGGTDTRAVIRNMDYIQGCGLK